MTRQVTDGVRKAVETFCLTGGIYTSILLALKFSHGAGMTDALNPDFRTTGLSEIYFPGRLTRDVR